MRRSRIFSPCLIRSTKERLFLGLSLTLLAALAAWAGYRMHLRVEKAPVRVNVWRLPSGPLFITEDASYPKLQEYRRRERLDDVVNPRDTDFKQILALAQWASRQFKASTPFPRYPPWDATIILDRIRRGKTGGYCAQYAFIFGQACQSFGYQPRYLDLASADNNGGHFTTEIFVPSLQQWIVFEPEWGIYYEDEKGRRLNALQLHQWAVRERQGVVWKRPLNEPVPMDFLQNFYYFRYYLRNNYLSVPVFVKWVRGTRLLFAPYRLAWKDAFTDNDRNAGSGFMSSDPAEFEAPIRMSEEAPVFCPHRIDIYRALALKPPFTLYPLDVPHDVLVRLIQFDFVHDPSYYPLRE